MKKIILINVLLTLVISIQAQVSIDWTTVIEADLDNNYAYKNMLLNDEAGNIYLAGDMLNGSLNQDVKLIKTDTTGSLLWELTMDGTAGLTDKFEQLHFTPSGDILLLYESQMAASYMSEMVIEKYDPAATNLMRAAYTGTDTSFYDCAVAIAHDGSLFTSASSVTVWDHNVCGDPVPEVYRNAAMKINPTGGVDWQNFFGDTTIIYASNVMINANGNPTFFSYYLPNEISPFPYFLIYKIDQATSNVEVLYEEESEFGIGKSILDANDNIFWTTESFFRINKLNAQGAAQWEFYFETNLPQYMQGDKILDVHINDDGSIIATGKHYGENYGTSDFTNADILTIKVDPNGNLLWDSRYVFDQPNNIEFGKSITVDQFGDVYVVGQSQTNGSGSDYDIVLLKYDGNTGDQIFSIRIDPDGNETDNIPTDVLVDANNDIYISGLTDIGNTFDHVIVKLTQSHIGENIINKNTVQIYPNPVHSDLHVKCEQNARIKLFSIEGKLMGSFQAQSGEFVFDMSSYEKGMYLIEVISPNGFKAFEKVFVY